ncbi:MBL fold metallo-hydrolase [Candidatus Roizmanbacteria bacterium]|nr:MBL fold metallo-hydrolase [Candidatus Roizmanbacteria bacterium]
MQVFSYPLGQLQANCFLLVKDHKCFIIDPGDCADFILEQVNRQALDVVGILATHGHFDHILAVGELQLSLDAPLYIHPSDVFLVDRMESTARRYLSYESAALSPSDIEPIAPGPLDILPFHVEVIHTPGHTPGSCCYFFKDENIVFSGDTLFCQGVGSYDHAYSDKIDLQDSVDRLFALPEETLVYPGHGEETTIAFEKKHPIL